MKKWKTGFIRSNAIFLIIMDFFFGGFLSLLPEESLRVFLLNMFVMVFGIILSFYWYRVHDDEEKYNSLVGFLALLSMGFYGSIPFMRVTYGTLLFYVVFVIYFGCLSFILIKIKWIVRDFANPVKSKLLKGVMGIAIVGFLVGGMFPRDGHPGLILSFIPQNQHAFLGTMAMYVIGLFFTFISVSVLSIHYKK